MNNLGSPSKSPDEDGINGLSTASALVDFDTAEGNVSLPNFDELTAKNMVGSPHDQLDTANYRLVFCIVICMFGTLFYTIKPFTYSLNINEV